MNHTPGPWKIGPAEPEFREGFYILDSQDKAVVGTCCGAGIYKPADAKLIAIAPDLADLVESAWGVIANAHWGNWDLAPAEWKAAAEAWRDRYHALLEKRK